MMTPVLAAPSEMVVMLTFPGGETGDPLLTKIPPASNATSVSIGVAPAPASRCPKDHIPCTTNDPVATVVKEVVMEVLAAAAVFVVKASGCAAWFTLNQEAAW